MECIGVCVCLMLSPVDISHNIVIICVPPIGPIVCMVSSKKFLFIVCHNSNVPFICVALHIVSPSPPFSSCWFYDSDIRFYGSLSDNFRTSCLTSDRHFNQRTISHPNWPFPLIGRFVEEGGRSVLFLDKSPCRQSVQFVCHYFMMIFHITSGQEMITQNHFSDCYHLHHTFLPTPKIDVWKLSYWHFNIIRHTEWFPFTYSILWINFSFIRILKQIHFHSNQRTKFRYQLG